MLHSQTLVNQLWELSLNYPDTVSWSASVLSGGNLITTGNTFNSIAQKANIVTTKTDQSGSVVWQTEYNGTESEFDYGAAVTVDGSGNVFVTGASHASDDYTFDVVVIKYNSSGVQQWATTFNGTGNSTDIPSDILLIGSDIYVCAASVGSTTNYDYLLLKLNASGVVQWNKRYDYASLYDIPGHLATNSSGNIIVSGASQSSTTNWDYTSLKYNTSGTLLDTKRNTATGYGFDRPTGLVVDADDNFYITGYTFNGSNYDMRTIKLDDDLSTIWTKTENGGAEDGSNGVCIDEDANIYIAGFSESSTGNKLMRIIKYDSSGTKLWTKTLQNSSNDIDAEASGITFNTSNNKVIVTGFYTYTTGKKVITTFALNSNNGNLNWKKDYPNLSASIDVPTNVLTNNNFIWVYGRRTDDDTTRYVTVKYETYELSTENIVDSLGNPICRDNQLIVRFNPQLLDKDFIDNKQEVFANLESILEDTTYDKIAQLLKGTNTQFSPKAIKIYKQFTSNDTTSITRTGDTIRLPEFWASLLVTVDASVDEFILSDTLSYFVGEFLYSHLNWLGFQFDDSNDEDYTLQQSLYTTEPDFENAHIEIEGAWGFEVGDASIKVGVLENAIDWSHEDFGDGTITGSKIKGGYDFVNNVDYYAIGLPLENEHGTNVAGIIGALRNNEIGIAGIAGGDNTIGIDNPGVSLYELKCYSEEGFSTISDMSDGIVTGSISGIEAYQGLDILNISGGFTVIATLDDYQELQSATDLAYRNEVIMCVARGQTSANTEDPDDPFDNSSYPASYLQNQNAWVICVGAAGNNGERKTPLNSDPGDDEDNFFSFIGGGIDLIAPGTSDLIWTTGISSDPDTDNDYIFFRNSSAAAPHVSGVASLMLSYVNDNPLTYNNLAPEDVEWIVQESADNFPTSEYPEEYDDFTGHGMLNATNALKWLELPYNRIIHYPTSSPASVYAYLVDEPDYVKIFIADPPGTLSAGVYLAEVWNVEFFYNHSIPASATFNAGWLRNSTTTGLEPIDLTEGEYIIPNITNVLGSDYLDGFDITSTTAKIKSRTYRITHTEFGSAVTPFYYPAAPLDIKVNYSIYITDPEATNVEELQNNSVNLLAYPNPTTSIASIHIDGSNLIRKVAVYNSQGENIQANFEVMGNSLIQLDLTNFANGLYDIYITLENGMYTSKILKQ